MVTISMKVGDVCPHCGQKRLRFTPNVRAFILFAVLEVMFILGAVSAKLLT